MAEIVVGFLLNELSIFLHDQHVNLGRGLQRDVQFIRDELGSMRAFLRDAEAKQDSDHHHHHVSDLQERIRQVREVAYDTEDVLGEFVMRFSRRHRADGFYGFLQKICWSIKNLKARHRIISEVKTIKSRVVDISERHKRYHDQPISISASVPNLDNDIRATSILIEEDKLVGIDEPKKELISRILDDHNSSLKIVSVVGMGGIGKTTIVKKVYDDTTLKKQFQCHVWLTISQTFQVMATIKNLIQQLYDEIREPVPPQVESMDVIRLSSFVKDFLQHRRYVLVLDDVWSINSWEALKYVLPDGNHGSRVILTTRIVDIASASCLKSHDYIYKMEPLSDQESWKLFCNRTFQTNHCPYYLEDVSRRILKKCDGLPLAIVAISGVLALKDKNIIGDWEMILHSLSGELESGNGKLDRIKRILFLSYNDLPHHLKSCFLYLSIYPEDHKIDVSDLLHKWIAQGFVQEKEGISSIEIATMYANELINRSLIQVWRTWHDGTLRFCRVHDFLRDMIVSKSRQQNFLVLATGLYHCKEQKFDKVRRLAIHDFLDNPQPQEFNIKDCFKNLRSMEFFGYINPLSISALSKFLHGGSKLLKVLDLRGASLQDIPEEVFKLFHLKYLCLQHTQVQIIPKSIGKLQNLEVLNLSQTNVTEMPAEILKLKKLRSIFVASFGNYAENFTLRGFKYLDGIGKLLSLEDLYVIEADNGKIAREIGKLTKLTNLNITKLRREDGKEFLSSLVKLTNLRSLSISSIKEDETLQDFIPLSSTPQSLKWLMLEGRLGRVPQWLISLQGLTILRLHNSGLRDEDRDDDDDELGGGGIRSLQDLPNLISLTLIQAYEGETLSFMAGGFRKLKKLKLIKLERLKRVTMEENSMPNLQKLDMTGCKLLEELPSGIENLNKLKSLWLYDLSDELIRKVQSLDEQSVEYQIIANIPKVHIKYWKNGAWHAYFS